MKKIYECELCCDPVFEKYGSGRFCSSFCARRFSTINKRNEINKKVSISMANKIKKNGKFGCLKDKEEKLNKICPMCQNDFFVHPCYINRTYCSKSCSDNDIYFKFKKKPEGGYRNGSGRGKSGYYKGVWCDSTYELAYVLYRLDHNIKFERNLKGFEYIWENKTHTYYPDFIEKGKYIEIKGYKTKKVITKAESVPCGVVVLYEKDLEKEFKYICEKYKIGKNRLYELYDDSKPKCNYLCANCNKSFGTYKKRIGNNIFCSRKCSGKYRYKENKKRN